MGKSQNSAGSTASDNSTLTGDSSDREHRNRILESLEKVTTYSEYIRVARQIRGRPWTGVPLPRRRLALLGSCTLDPLKPYLEALAFSWNVVLEVELLPYNQYAQQICGTQTRLWEFSPEAALLAVRLEDVAPDLYAHWGILSAAERDDRAASYAATLGSLLDEFRRRSAVPLVVFLPGRPAVAELGLGDEAREDSQAAFFERLRFRIRHLAASHPGVQVLDVDEAARTVGLWNLRNSKYESLGGIPFGPAGFHAIAERALRHLFLAWNLSRKCLVLDLDGTLWDGIVGELGAQGIQISARSRMIQRFAAALARRGVILALNSKNDLATVRDVFATRADLALRLEAFAAIAVNWESKAANLATIAAELNIGLDSLVFLDDSPQERMEIRMLHPEVIVPPLPDETATERFFESLPVFESAALTREDAARSGLYASERQRTEHRAGFTDAASFLHSLEMRASIFRATEEDLPRASQLSLRTNQFNTTTRRFDVGAMKALTLNPHWRVYLIRTADRFGDQGVVGLGIVDRSGDLHHLTSFLLSCRVLARGIEELFLLWLVEESRRASAVGFCVDFIPSAKNAPVARFLKEQAGTVRQPDGSFLIPFSSGAAVAFPGHILLEVAIEHHEPLG